MSNPLQYEDVVRAAEELAAKGETPTSTKVRDLLGRGSYSTAARHLAAWRAARTEERRKYDESGFTPELREELLRAVGQVVLRFRTNPQVQHLNRELEDAHRETIRLADLLESANSKTAEATDLARRSQLALESALDDGRRNQEEMERLRRQAAEAVTLREQVTGLQEALAKSEDRVVSAERDRAALETYSRELREVLEELRELVGAQRSKTPPKPRTFTRLPERPSPPPA